MCFAVVVGKKASADGSVLFGHNEQNAGVNQIHYRRIPRRSFAQGSTVELKGGGRIKQVPKTYSYLWVESIGLEFSDNCFNEWGVAVAGNGCPTKEDSIEVVTQRGDISDGGIGYMLPRLVAERSKCAREGVEQVISLVERYGYTGSGRSLVIADPNEAWVIALARGKHYVAQRVPDDAVVVIPNTHVIGSEASLDDVNNVLASVGIEAYALQREWWHTETQGKFSFAASFASPQASGMEREWGVCSRQWQAQALVSGQRAELSRQTTLPFAVVPNKPLSVSDVALVLRSHQEGTEYDLSVTSPAGSPHEPEQDIDASFARSVCNIATQESVIWQLRSFLPPQIGCIAWRATSVPCVSVYTPWYLAVDHVPTAYHDGASIESALELRHHFMGKPSPCKPSQNAYWAFWQLAQLVEKDYAALSPSIKSVWQQWESEQYAWQSVVENAACELAKKDPLLAQNYLSSYSIGRALAAWQRAQQMLQAESVAK